MTRRIIATALLALGLGSDAFAQATAAYPVMRAATPPNIDGVLDDAAWTQVAPMPTGDWVSYNRELVSTVNTKVRRGSGCSQFTP